MYSRVRFKLNNNLFMDFSTKLLFLYLITNICDNGWAVENITDATNRYLLTTTGIDINKNSNKNTLFKCPEQFGYYPDDKDCTKYYVCVFGDPLHENCTGGLYFSSELQTCDWPRNVECAHDLLTDHQKYSDQQIGNAFNRDLDQTIGGEVDRIYDNNGRNVEKNINNKNNNDLNKNNDNEDRDVEEVDDESGGDGDEEADEDRGESDPKSNDYIFDDNDSQTNGTEYFADALDLQKTKTIGDGSDNRVAGIIGRSADGTRGHESSAEIRFRDLHGNKVNIETDPQQPSYEEAYSSVVDEMGTIHIHDGPGGLYGLPDKHHINRFQSPINLNDKDLGFIEQIAADRRPIVRVTRVRKRMRNEGPEDREEITDRNLKNYSNDKSLKSKYIPLIVMDKEDVGTDREEKVRRYRSDDNFKSFGNSEDVLSTSTHSSHFQNQKQRQQEYFREQNQPKETPVPNMDSKQKIELRGFVTTRDSEGKVVAIPIFKDMINADSLQPNRRKRVRVVHRVLKPDVDMDTMPVIARTSPPKSSQLQQKLLPRILVPEQSQWQPYLPFYGPSLTQLKKVQLLPPMGPIPALKEPELNIMDIFRPKQQTIRSKPKPKISDILIARNEEFEKRASISRSDTTARPAVRIPLKPKRPKNKQKTDNRGINVANNRSANKTMTTKQTSKPMIESTTQSFIEFVVKNDNNRQNNGREGREQHSPEALKIKLTRNGKRLQNKDNVFQTTASPLQTTTVKTVRQKERIVISNTGAQPLNSYDYYEFPYVENASNHTITYLTTIDELNPTTVAPIAPSDQSRGKQTTNKRKQNRPKKGSSAPASRPAPVYPTPALLSTATKCTASKCRLPDCFCGGTGIPNGLSSADIPQMVMITFDDSINDLNWEIYDEVFSNRHNPNGCPILGTFYVSHEWTDYGQVQTLYSRGHEMASHSITHSFGEKFSVQKWTKEMTGQREILHMFGGVQLADVRGMRAPFLQGGGNKQFEMLYESNFTYDSTMPVFENSPPYWPYTLDYAINHECMIAPCPTKSFPGVWEVGMVMWHDLKGGRCSMGDACSNPSDEDGVHKMLLKNFNRHYQSNRAPFGLYYHSAWFNTPYHRKGFIRFIDEILTKKDVYFVTKYQMIQWIRDPTPLSKIKSFQAWNCNFDERPAPCKSPTVCNVGSKSGSRFLKTCQSCPTQYPWVGNTGFTTT